MTLSTRLTLLIGGVALLHMACGWLATLLAGLAPNAAALQGLAALLTFPARQLPEPFHRTPAHSLATSAVCSLLVAAVLVLPLVALQAAAGTLAATAGAASLGLVLAGGWWWLAHPADNWDDRGHRHLSRHCLMLPLPIVESAEEKAAEYRIHENLYPGQPFLPTSNRWYWNDRAGLSGHPSDDAMVLAMQADAVPSQGEFLARLGQQRDPVLAAADWPTVQTGERWVLQTALPNRAPLPTHERDRLIRAWATEPKSGSYPACGRAAGGLGGPMIGAMRSLM